MGIAHSDLATSISAMGLIRYESQKSVRGKTKKNKLSKYGYATPSPRAKTMSRVRQVSDAD